MEGLVKEMLKKKFVKFFVVVSVLASLVCVGGKATYATSVKKPKMGIEIKTRFNFRKKLEDFNKKFSIKTLPIREFIKDKGNEFIEEASKRKNKITRSIADKLVKIVTGISENDNLN